MCAVASLLNGEKNDWKKAQGAMANPKEFIDKVRQIKQRMDQGEDFSGGLKHASKVVDDPQITKESV